VKVKVTLTDKDGFSFSSTANVTSLMQDIVLSLADFAADSSLLLPRPYPGFMPLYFRASGSSVLRLSEVEKIQVTIGTDVPESEFKKPYGLEVGKIWFQKN
jgi:hypothetical protein